MENIPANLISLVALSLVMLVALLLLALKSRLSEQVVELSKQVQNQALMLSDLQMLLAKSQTQLNENKHQCDESLLENEQVSKQLEHRIKVIQEQFKTQLQTIEQLLQQQPEDKLYSRAQKLVELGADVEEIMRECDIPRPEAEMLMAVHKQQSSNY
ncbi:DUF2802 domain-containing protein [Cognaticolwellia mytili]|uniref:DUF2802 domain-containing protein n=1 Tax=Cognaticolwellia mytili TaxID=1888913 RepID=UPI000A17874C|nr:DUF2802 domain-containing protein [Cognaticolwellia mytili]